MTLARDSFPTMGANRYYDWEQVHHEWADSLLLSEQYVVESVRYLELLFSIKPWSIVLDPDTRLAYHRCGGGSYIFSTYVPGVSLLAVAHEFAHRFVERHNNQHALLTALILEIFRAEQ
jgi:hypothetical protein